MNLLWNLVTQSFVESLDESFDESCHGILS